MLFATTQYLLKLCVYQEEADSPVTGCLVLQILLGLKGKARVKALPKPFFQVLVNNNDNHLMFPTTFSQCAKIPKRSCRWGKCERQGRGQQSPLLTCKSKLKTGVFLLVVTRINASLQRRHAIFILECGHAGCEHIHCKYCRRRYGICSWWFFLSFVFSFCGCIWAGCANICSLRNSIRMSRIPIY